MKPNYETLQLEVDYDKLNYYNRILDHAKKFMMDFKVSSHSNQEPSPVKNKQITLKPSQVQKNP